MARVLRSVVLLLCVAGCDASKILGNGDALAPAKPVTWVNDVWTQPVPSWGSPVRLGLPVALGDILLGGAGSIGAFGGHQGGHVEGLNHVWIPTRLGIPVRSWAAGKVTKIEDMGSRGTPDGLHEFFITIDYGQGLRRRTRRLLRVAGVAVRLPEGRREGGARRAAGG
ncbi:MAG: hypothetical protein NTW72_07290 [Gemmatimonadetes bacterium]|nr:hypothetical protein [Gemmatimonadota bacterium]